jgi:hypothetical protein
MSKKRQKRFLKPTKFNPKGHWMVGMVWSVKGSKGNEYSIELHDQGFDCDCTGFAFHGRCKHSQSIVKQVEEAVDGRYTKYQSI